MAPPSQPPAQDELQETVVIAAPHDEVQDYLESEAVPEDNIPVLRAARRPRGARQSRDQLAAASVSPLWEAFPAGKELGDEKEIRFYRDY
jgi:hypothetical protein